MQRGFVFCNTDRDQVLCINQEKTGFLWKDVESTQVLNQAICLSDLTEAKNICNRIVKSELANDLEIINVARLYKKFF
jgi:hypothetical protein